MRWWFLWYWPLWLLASGLFTYFTQFIVLLLQNKSTTSIIPRYSNYMFMHQSYHSENVWHENDGGTDNNPKPDLDNINGQITILKQILIISMHIASLVKMPCYLLKLSSENEKIGVSRADNSVKFDEICPLAIPKQISLRLMHIASLVKISCYLLVIVWKRKYGRVSGR